MEEKSAEHEQHYLKIQNRWRIANMKYMVPCALLVLLHFFFMERFTGLSEGIRLWISIFFAIVCLSYSAVQGRKETAKKLTETEHEHLLRVAKTSKNKMYRLGAEQLLLVSEKIHPQWEYLRASQEPQDETLLHAASSTDTTPQDQLLRPSQTTEE